MLAQKYFPSVENIQISIGISGRTRANAVALCFPKQMHLYNANIGLVFLEESLKLHVDLRMYQATLVLCFYKGDRQQTKCQNTFNLNLEPRKSLIFLDKDRYSRLSQ